ncbi:hypothetical protein DICVIV_05001 [Dictyocaulus viviparus]|uniref:Uncharacterized protein n=1 Tax=Dictyocaulus viviparus TaxID=29172 RepID=A0A0D8XWJ1_DICVI|nr:hypothetical protein DICVIV_05001 [Dictyocaulus viviparus]
MMWFEYITVPCPFLSNSASSRFCKRRSLQSHTFVMLSIVMKVETFQEHDDDDRDSLGGDMDRMLRDYPTTLTTFETTAIEPDGTVQTISRRVETRVRDPILSHVTFTGTESEERVRDLPMEEQFETVDAEGNITRTVCRRRSPPQPHINSRVRLQKEQRISAIKRYRFNKISSSTKQTTPPSLVMGVARRQNFHIKLIVIFVGCNFMKSNIIKQSPMMKSPMSVKNGQALLTSRL